MSEEEALADFKREYDDNKREETDLIIDFETAEVLLNLIQKQQEEIENKDNRIDELEKALIDERMSCNRELEKKDKIIDVMAKYMAENMAEFELDEIYEKQYNCNGMERNWTRGDEAEIKDIKQYFERKVENGKTNI